MPPNLSRPPHVPAVTHTSSSGASTTPNPNVPSNTTLPATTPGISSPQAKLFSTWRRVSRICKSPAKVVLAIFGSIVTYLALSTAMWSAAKDYRDDCRNQNSTYGYVSQTCTEVLHAVLSKPIGLSMFVSESSNDEKRLIRKDEASVRKEINADGYRVTKVLLIAMVNVFVIYRALRPCVNRILRAWNSMPNGHDLELNARHLPNNPYNIWIESSISGRGVVTSATLDEEITTILRRQISLREDTVEDDNYDENDDCLPTNSSVLNHNLRPDTVTAYETFRPSTDNASLGGSKTLPCTSQSLEIAALDNLPLPRRWETGFQANIQQDTPNAESIIQFRGMTVNTGVSSSVDKILHQNSLRNLTHSRPLSGWYDPAIAGNSAAAAGASNSENAKAFSQLLEQQIQQQHEAMMVHMEKERADVFLDSREWSLRNRTS